MQEDEGIDWKVNHAKTTISLALSCSNAEVGKIELRQNLPREAVSSAVSMRVRASFFSRGLQVNINDWNLSFIQVFNFTRLISVLILDSHTPNDLEWSRRESKLYFQMTFLTSRSFTRWFLFPAIRSILISAFLITLHSFHDKMISIQSLSFLNNA